MASAVADLDAGLQAMLNLKPPGVSGSRITSLTTLCVANIQVRRPTITACWLACRQAPPNADHEMLTTPSQSESVLIQKIYTHFKKAPGTHKLGVLYVVDSVTRKWLEQAKSQGQPVNSSAQDGTYAAGVHRVTELMPVLMNDILQSAPDEQKVRIYFRDVTAPTRSRSSVRCPWLWLCLACEDARPASFVVRTCSCIGKRPCQRHIRAASSALPRSQLLDRPSLHSLRSYRRPSSSHLTRLHSITHSCMSEDP